MRNSGSITQNIKGKKMKKKILKILKQKDKNQNEEKKATRIILEKNNFLRNETKKAIYYKNQKYIYVFLLFDKKT